LRCWIAVLGVSDIHQLVSTDEAVRAAGGDDKPPSFRFDKPLL
jgi:hypothetical protein